MRYNFFRIGAVALVIALGSVSAFAQVDVPMATDPTGEMYEQIEIWQARGILGRLEPVRPYPIPVLMNLLHQVEASPLARATDLELAKRWLESLQGAFDAGLEIEVRGRAWTDQVPDADGATVATAGAGQSYLHFFPFFGFQGNLTDWLSAAAVAKIWLINNEDGAVLPKWTATPEDLITDSTDVSVGESNFLVRQMSHAMTAFTAPDNVFSFQMGILRSSIGPFFDNGIVLGPQAPAQGHFSLVLRQPDFSVTLAFFPLVAQPVSGSGIASNKYLIYHELYAEPVPGFELSVFETVMYGGRIEPLYFLPLSAFFHSQGMTGFADNSFLGFNTRVVLSQGLSLAGTVYLDDLHFNDMVRFEFNTKYKLAAQLGLSWAPDDNPLGLDLVRFDYTAVMPYMYSHINSMSIEQNPLGFNYEEYSHWGQNLGPDLPPNSDRFNLLLRMRPLLTGLQPGQANLPGDVDIDLGIRLIRHGNASAGIIPLAQGGDGSLQDGGYLNGVPTFQAPFVDPTGQPYTRFLTQPVLEHILQIDLEASWRLAFMPSNARLFLGYNLEHIWNADLVSGLQRTSHYFRAMLGWYY